MSQPSNRQYTDIVNLVLRHSNCSRDQLLPETRIGEDLYIVGDDAVELLEEFKSEFGVDLSSFQFEDFFPDEATADMHYYMCAIASRARKPKVIRVLDRFQRPIWRLLSKKRHYNSLTLGDLFNAASLGKCEARDTDGIRS